MQIHASTPPRGKALAAPPSSGPQGHALAACKDGAHAVGANLAAQISAPSAPIPSPDLDTSSEAGESSVLDSLSLQSEKSRVSTLSMHLRKVK